MGLLCFPQASIQSVDFFLPSLFGFPVEKLLLVTNRSRHVMGKSELPGPRGSPDSVTIPAVQSEQELAMGRYRANGYFKHINKHVQLIILDSDQSD